MSHNPTITQPPVARSILRSAGSTNITEADRVVNTQPTPASTMTTARGGESGNGAMRLRGGCIPCPDGSCCYIIPIPCCC